MGVKLNQDTFYIQTKKIQSFIFCIINDLFYSKFQHLSYKANWTKRYLDTIEMQM